MYQTHTFGYSGGHRYLTYNDLKITGGNGSGAMISSVGNPDIEPERIKELEWGIDLTWKNLLSLEFSSYNQSAENSVIYRPLAPSLGYGSLSKPDNIGSMEM